MDYYRVNDGYIHEVMEKVQERFSSEEVKQLEQVLRIVSDELM